VALVPIPENGMAEGDVSPRADVVRAKASAGSSQLKLFRELLVKLGFEYIKDSFLLLGVVMAG
jgi:hypothetical protein